MNTNGNFKIPEGFPSVEKLAEMANAFFKEIPLESSGISENVTEAHVSQKDLESLIPEINAANATPHIPGTVSHPSGEPFSEMYSGFMQDLRRLEPLSVTPV